jgi:hypothetical protein
MRIRIQGAKPMRIHAASCGSGYGSWSDFKVTKIEILHEKYTYSGKRVKKHTYEGKKAFLEGRKRGLFLNFGRFPCSLVRILYSYTDPDPAK